MSVREDVVICGAGIVGAALAYYLTVLGLRPLVVEARSVASGASGKAVGVFPRPRTRAPAARCGPFGSSVSTCTASLRARCQRKSEATTDIR